MFFSRKRKLTHTQLTTSAPLVCTRACARMFSLTRSLIEWAEPKMDKCPKSHGKYNGSNGEPSLREKLSNGSTRGCIRFSDPGGRNVKKNDVPWHWAKWAEDGRRNHKANLVPLFAAPRSSVEKGVWPPSPLPKGKMNNLSY